MVRKLHDYEVTRVAAHAICKRETVRAYLTHPDRMKPATRARIEAAFHALGYAIQEPFTVADREVLPGSNSSGSSSGK